MPIEYIKISFLSNLFPKTYSEICNFTNIALIYTAILLIVIPLSLFFHNGFIQFFIDCMLGWTLLGIPYVAVLIIALDKQITITIDDFKYSKPKVVKTLQFKLTKIWGITLCALGITLIYFSNKYKQFYDFQCQEFYLDTSTGIYHIFDNCDDIDNNGYMDANIESVTGEDLINTDSSLCIGCKERAEDYGSDYSYMYRRK